MSFETIRHKFFPFFFIPSTGRRRLVWLFIFHYSTQTERLIYRTNFVTGGAAQLKKKKKKPFVSVLCPCVCVTPCVSLSFPCPAEKEASETRRKKCQCVCLVSVRARMDGWMEYKGGGIVYTKSIAIYIYLHTHTHTDTHIIFSRLKRRRRNVGSLSWVVTVRGHRLLNIYLYV